MSTLTSRSPDGGHVESLARPDRVHHRFESLLGGEAHLEVLAAYVLRHLVVNILDKVFVCKTWCRFVSRQLFSQRTLQLVLCKTHIISNY